MPDTKPTELLRVGLGSTPMTIGQLERLTAAVGARDTDTLRHRNGSLIVERPVPEQDS